MNLGILYDGPLQVDYDLFESVFICNVSPPKIMLNKGKSSHVWVQWHPQSPDHMFNMAVRPIAADVPLGAGFQKIP